MNQELKNYSLNSEDALANFTLALYFFSQNHVAAASSFFLRAAERFEDENQAYDSLIYLSFCFDKAGGRNLTYRNILNQAIALLPLRPEAYVLLSKSFEASQEWERAYIYAHLGLSLGKNLDKINYELDYPGKYILIFQKAVAAWWWGKGNISRNLFKELIENYWNEMTDLYKKCVENNMKFLGIDSIFYQQYEKKNFEKFKRKFPGLENVKKNYSQIYQDLFVLAALEGKRNGVYLEIGGGDPFYLNNTYLLEKDFNWTGVSIDMNKELTAKYENERKNTKVICENSTQIDFEKLIDTHLSPNLKSNVIDYLQLDVEPSGNTFETLLRIPFDKYMFSVITYEHDHYVDPTQPYREKSRRYLKMMGYELVVNDVSFNSVHSFEDWWVHPKLISEETLLKIRSIKESTQSFLNYFFHK